MLEEAIFDFRYVRLYDVYIPKEKWLQTNICIVFVFNGCKQIFANSGEPRSAASDLGLHCLPFARFGISSLQWVKDLLVFI